MLYDIKHDFDTYTFRDKVAKICLLFFIGLYFLFTFDPINWTGIYITGFMTLCSFSFIFYNDRKFGQFEKLKEKIIGGIITIIFSIIALIYSMSTYSFSFF